MLLMIDNYDSFTYNIVQYFGELGQDVKVFRNDEITIDDIARLDPEYLVISPGPCAPAQAGISLAAIKEFSGKIPVLGVCLGHQSIGEAFGGKIVHAKQLMHGKVSAVHHKNEGVFKGLPNPLTCTRYHSLAIERESLPECLDVTAWTDDGEIMGVRHKTLAVEGVQFHPESILTERGHDLLNIDGGVQLFVTLDDRVQTVGRTAFNLPVGDADRRPAVSLRSGFTNEQPPRRCDIGGDQNHQREATPRPAPLHGASSCAVAPASRASITASFFRTENERGSAPLSCR